MPDETVFAIDGDGCFQMTLQELITASIERIPVKIAVMNNNSLGMVKQWQRLFYNERYSAVDLSDHTPDYVKLAEAMGCVGLRADDADDVAPTLEKALCHRRPAGRRRVPLRPGCDGVPHGARRWLATTT